MFEGIKTGLTPEGTPEDKEDIEIKEKINEIYLVCKYGKGRK